MDLINESGYDTLKQSVIGDIEQSDCFNANGCNWKTCRCGEKETSFTKRCFHRYCDKFKWVIDRANHYSEKLGIDPMELLKAWEKQRTYWYMNYYQDINQPLVSSDHVYVFNTIDDFKINIGEKIFRCPACLGVSTNPYNCNSGKKINGKICDWKMYGLITLNHAFVFIKEKLSGNMIFMPLSWENGRKCQ